MTATATSRDRWYPCPPPRLDGENDDSYAGRLTGADGTGREPYDHERSPGCSAGRHSECPDPAGTACRCPHHHDTMTGQEAGQLRPETRKAGEHFAGLYDLPPVTGYRVMAITAVRAGSGLPDPAVHAAIGGDLASTYQSRAESAFLEDALDVWRAAESGTLPQKTPGS